MIHSDCGMNYIIWPSVVYYKHLQQLLFMVHYKHDMIIQNHFYNKLLKILYISLVEKTISMPRILLDVAIIAVNITLTHNVNSCSDLMVCYCVIPDCLINSRHFRSLQPHYLSQDSFFLKKVSYAASWFLQLVLKHSTVHSSKWCSPLQPVAIIITKSYLVFSTNN